MNDTIVTTSMPMIFSDAQVASLLTPQMAYDGIVDAMSCHARGEFIQPLKPYIRPKGREDEYEGGRFIAMPGYLGGNVRIAGIKWIAGFPANIDKGLPRASGVLVLNDIETGIPLAIMDCTTVSARRTAAVAAVAVDQLAPHGPRRVAIFGAGPIAWETIHALCAVERGIEQISLFDLREQRARDMAQRAGAQLGCAVAVSPTAEACVRGANVIITATTGGKNWLQLSWLNKPWLIIALSLDDCTPEVFLAADKVIVDDFEQCNREEKLLHKLVQAGRFGRDQLYAELGQVVIGQKPGREGDEAIYMNPMGMAIEDLAVAARVYRALAGDSL